MFIWKYVLIMSLLLFYSNPSAQIVENLDEMFRRKSRRIDSNYILSELEKSKQKYMHQSETFFYYDNKTGAEIWKMTSSPGKLNVVWDIGLSPWSADGKRMTFYSNRKTAAYRVPDGYNHWFVCNTDGTHLRPLVKGCARLSNHRPFFGWSAQIPDTYYMFGWPDNKNRTHKNILYKNTVYDSSITSIKIIEFPTLHGKDLFINKLISSDGRKIIAMPFTEVWLYPASIYPDKKAKLDDPDGYKTGRITEKYGTTPESFTTLHDQYMVGDGKWFFVMPSGSNAWWRIKTTGSSEDGGPNCNHNKFPLTTTDLPYDFGECWPENTVEGTVRDPFGSPYWSHFCPDQWGRYARGSFSIGSRYGPGIWDIQKHKIANLWSGDCVHHAWNGFTDWIVNSTSFRDCQIYAQNAFDKKPSKMINSTYTSFNGGNSYENRARPGQSPDGTKVSWHSEFLNNGKYADLFWSVVIYPKPPTDLWASVGKNELEISFLPPRYTQRNWPYYTSNPELDSLGWPLLDENGNEKGEPLYAREVKKYHLWRSSNLNHSWRFVSSVEASYSYVYNENPDWFMLHPVHNDKKVSPKNKITIIINIPKKDIYYYALTSVEHSGLESRKLSEVLEIKFSENKIASQTIIRKEGITGFWKIRPPAPEAFKCSAGIREGHYRLSWKEPDYQLIRFFNIYYSTTDSTPKPVVNNRMASVVKGTNYFYDWLASPEKANYTITSVDYQGNESEPASRTFSVKKEN